MNKMLVDLATGETSIVPMTAEEIAAQEAMAAAVAALPYSLYKTDIISRMTDEEVEAFDTALAGASARLRRMWLDCQKVESDSPFFAGLKASFAAQLGDERAEAILAREG